MHTSRRRAIVCLLLLQLTEFVVGATYEDLPVTARNCHNDDTRVEHAAAVIRAENRDDNNAILYRLPNNTRPISYGIHLVTHVHRADFSFAGTVRIRLQVLAARTRSVALHARQLTIGAARLVHVATSATVAVQAAPVYTEANEQLSVSVRDSEPDLIVGDEYVLSIDFAGVLSERLRGFYRTSYVADDASIRWLAGTHFEPTNARHGFPCFDEPGLRATFQLTITHGADYHALSNMPITKSSLSADGLTKTTEFAATPPMPTYLNAWVVSDFKSIGHTDTAGTGFTQRIYARPNAIDRAPFALATGRRTLAAFASRFGVNYTLPKLDQIAVPGFAGAMENWGLIIYDEELLLFANSDDSYLTQTGIATTIVHEIAHQWFGNLVTNKWWTFNWLNEGFATLFENHGVDWLFPNWRWMDRFVFAVTQNVMIEDATNATRPMSRYVESPAEISSNFDNIGYSKSGAVLNMFMHAFSAPTFIDGLHRYLTGHPNSVAVEDDLFAALQQAVLAAPTTAPQFPAGFTVAAAMSSWTRQSGYPLVRVTRNYTTAAVALRQQRYFSDPDQANDTMAVADSTTWWIPYNLATAATVADFNQTHATDWLPPTLDSSELRLSGAQLRANDWLLINKQQTGYYRVLYDTDNYNLLAVALQRPRHSDIPVASRAQLVDDVLELAFAERLSYATVLHVLRFLVHETDSVPWASAVRGLRHIERLHAGSPKIHAYRTYIGKRFAHLYDELATGKSPATADAADDGNAHRLRGRELAIEWACRYGHRLCQTDTGAVLRDIVAGNRTIAALPLDHRNVVLCAATRNATAVAFARLWELVLRENAAWRTHPARRRGLFAVLACPTNATLLDWVLHQTLNATDSEQWTWSERYEVFRLVADSWEGVALAIRRLDDMLSVAVEKFGARNVGNVLQTIAGRSTNNELRLKVDQLLARAELNQEIEKNALLQAKAVMARNARWIARNRAVIDEWIEKNGAVSKTMTATVLLFACAFIVSFM